MNDVLTEANQLLVSISPCIDFADIESEKEKLLAMTKEELREFQKRCHGSLIVKEKAMQMLSSVVPRLTHEEIVEGYREGCITFKRYLGGLMYSRIYQKLVTGDVLQLYANAMIEGIKNDDSTSYLFLGALSLYMPDEFVQDMLPSIILIALDQKNQRTLDTAIAIAEQRKMKEAIPKIQVLTNHPNERLRGIAIKALEILNQPE